MKPDMIPGVVIVLVRWCIFEYSRLLYLKRCERSESWRYENFGSLKGDGDVPWALDANAQKAAVQWYFFDLLFEFY